MQRSHLEHLIRAAAEITNEYEFVVIGSQMPAGPVPAVRRARRSAAYSSSAFTFTLRPFTLAPPSRFSACSAMPASTAT